MFTTEEIKLAKQGDKEILEKIIKTYQKNFYFIKKHMFFIGGDFDDMLQEGTIGLLKAIKGYENDKNTSFDYFANLCIKRQILSKITQYNSKKHSLLNCSINYSFPVTIEEQEYFKTTPEDILIEQEIEEELSKYAKEYLSKFENKIYLYLIEGYSYLEIAKLMNISAKKADNGIQRIRKKFNFYDIREKIFKT